MRLAEMRAHLAREVRDGGGEGLPELPDVDPERTEARADEAQAGEEAGERPSRAGGHDQPRVAAAEAPRLLVDLDGGPHVAEGAEPGVPAHRDEVVGPDAQAGEEPGEADGRLERPRARPLRREREEVHPRAEELVEQEVAGEDLRAGLEVEEVRLHPEEARGRGGEPGVVRLQPAEGRDLRRPLPLRLRHQVLELARLVAAEGRAEEVVALHEDRPAQLGREPRQPLERRRRLAEDDPRVGVEAREELRGGQGRGSGARRFARRFPRATMVRTVGRSSASGKTLASQT